MKIFSKISIRKKKAKKSLWNFVAKSFFFSLLFFSFFFVASTSVYAATYYVDATTGSDSDTGLTEDLAWQTLAKVTGASFIPGDSILFKKGETWSGGLAISSSGTPGNMITYGAYGSGADPIIDRTGGNYAVNLTSKSYVRIEGLKLQNATLGQILIYNNSVSNIEIDSVTTSGGNRGIYLLNDMDNITISNSTLTNHTSDAISVEGVQSNLTFTNVTTTDTVRGIYLSGTLSTVAINSSTFSGLSSYGIEINLNQTVTNLDINDSHFDNDSMGIYSRGTIAGMTIDDSFFNSNSASGITLVAGAGMTVEDVTINNTEIDDNSSTGINFAGTSGSHSNVSILNSTISNNNGYGFYVTNTIDNVDITDTTANGNGGDGIYFYMDTGTAATDIDIIDTVANSNGGNGFSFHGVGLSDDAVLTRVTASNNDNDGINIKSGWTNVNVYNCTVELNGVDGVGSDGDGVSYHNTTTGIVKYCNIYNNLKTAVAHVGDSDVNMSYNIFRHDTNGTLALTYVEGTGTYTFYNNVIYSAAQTGTGLQINSGTTATVKNNIIYGFDTGFHDNGGTVTADYNLVYNAGSNNWSGLSQGTNSLTSDPLFIDRSSNNFRLQATSPAINVGTSVGETLDYLGNNIFGTPDIGAYEIQSLLSPSTVSISGYTKDDARPTLSFRKSTDPSGISSYSINIDSGKNRSFSTSGIPSSGDGSASYIWKDDTDVRVEFLYENDSDSTNDEIRVYFKDLNNNELSEGKHSWSVTAHDSASNSTTQSADFYIDRTSPPISELAIADVSTVLADTLYNLDITNRMPSFSGLAADPYQGSTVTNSNGTKDTFDKVSSGPQTITLNFKRLDDGQDQSSSDATYTDYLTEDYSLSNIQNEADDKKFSRFYITTPYPLIDGYYQVNLSLKDSVGNVYNHSAFYLSINYQKQTPVGGLPSRGKLKTKIIEEKEIPAETKEEKGQGYTVQIKVVDKNKEVVKGAKVELFSEPKLAYTNDQGIAIFSNVEEGEHTIKIAYDGFTGEEKIKLEGEDVKEFDFTIQVKKESPFLNPLVISAIGIPIIISIILLIQNRRLKKKKTPRVN